VTRDRDDLERVEVVDDRGSVYIFRDRISDEPGPILKPTPKVRERKALRAKLRRVSSSVKEHLFVRDNFTCQWCKVPGGALDAHHKLARSAGGSDKVANLVSLHRLCHMQVHANPSEARRRGLIVGAGAKE
jgi:5-methylcytosine-specific restriction endonuclease McrA